MKQDLFHSMLDAQELSNHLAGLLMRKYDWAEAYERADAIKEQGRAALVAAIEQFN